MRPEQMNYIKELVEEIECLKLIKENTLSYWFPESPPTTLLLGDLGAEIAKKFYVLSEETKMHLFKHIEAGMNPSDEDLSTAVATGLIEELVKAGDTDSRLWVEIESRLGPESKEYAIAWKNSPY